MADPIPLYQDTRWLVTTVPALWGAGLASWDKWITRRDRKPKIAVDFREGLVTKFAIYTLGEQPGYEQVVSVTIRNVGHVPVTFELGCCVLEVKGAPGAIQMVYVSGKPKLPATIAHGQNINLSGPTHELELYFRGAGQGPSLRVRAKVVDAILREYFSSWQTVTLKDE